MSTLSSPTRIVFLISGAGFTSLMPSFEGNSSPPPLTPPTKGGEYSLSPCIPPPVPLTEGEKGGGIVGGEKGESEITFWFDAACVMTNSITSSCLFALGTSHATSVIFLSSAASLYSFKDTSLSTAKLPSCSAR